MYTIQPPLLALSDFYHADSQDRLVCVLSALDLDPLVVRLARKDPRGRRGYSVRAMLHALIAGWVYDLHSINALRRELYRNGSLRLICGFDSVSQVASAHAFSRLISRLSQHTELIEQMHARLIDRIRELHPHLGHHAAVDATSVAAWANGNRSQPADPDAAWGCKGHRQKGRERWWFGYKLHLAVDTETELVLAYTVTPADQGDSTQMEPLLERLDERLPERHLAALMADSQYDSLAIHEQIWIRGALPIIEYNHRGWPPPPGYAADGCPLCTCGTRMRYLGRDRVYVKYSAGPDCTCGQGIRRWRIDDDVRLHPPLPRHTKKWDRLYDERTAVERVNSRLKEHLRLRTLRHRGLDKARLHCGLSVLIQTAGCLGMMLAEHRELARSVVQLVA